MSYTPEQLTTLQHVVQDMDDMRDRRLRDLGPDKVLGEPEPDVVKVRGFGVQGSWCSGFRRHEVLQMRVCF